MQSVFDRVPSEIFRKIILHAYIYERDQNHEALVDDDLIDIDFEVVLPPIGASQVCRSWRQTLLADPIMWTCLPVPHLRPRAVTELIPRSKQALLVVYLDLNCYLTTSNNSNRETSAMLSALFKEVHRFRLLHVRASEPYSYCEPHILKLEEWMNRILTYLERPAPKLQSFGLWTHKLLEGTTLFNGEARNLKQLHYELSDNFFPSRRFLFDTNLVKLDVTLHAGIQFNRFLDLLELSPNLKSLLIRGPCHSIVVPSAGRQVTFPRLERFVIVKIMRLIVGKILAHISYPPSAKVHVTNESQWEALVRYNPDEAFRSSPALVPPSFLDFPLLGQ